MSFYHYMKYLRNEKGTFIIDSLLLLPLFFGPTIVFLTTRHLYYWLGRKKAIIPVLAILTLSGFWLIGGGLSLDFIRPYPVSELSGNDFMWNWPFNLIGVRIINRIPTYADFFSFWNIVALLFFIFAYPFMLNLGIQVGYLLFGRSEKQRGISDLFFKRDNKSEFN